MKTHKQLFRKAGSKFPIKFNKLCINFDINFFIYFCFLVTLYQILVRKANKVALPFQAFIFVYLLKINDLKMRRYINSCVVFLLLKSLNAKKAPQLLKKVLNSFFLTLMISDLRVRLRHLYSCSEAVVPSFVSSSTSFL